MRKLGYTYQNSVDGPTSHRLPAESTGTESVYVMYCYDNMYSARSEIGGP